jgi:aryl-alcohol dehydrogenase-like predicted oxidoreductase
MFAWQFQKALDLSAANGWTRFVSMQSHLNLIYREEEREMLPLCAAEAIGVFPRSPLARGRLTRPWGTRTERSEGDGFGRALYARTEEADRAVVGAVESFARANDVPMARVALAWVLAKPEVTAPIVGVSRPAQLEEALAALDVTLTPDDVSALDAPYTPHPVLGFS